MVVRDGNELLVISDLGTLVRTRVSEIRTMSRNTQGVMLIRLSDEEKLVGVVCLDEPEEEEEFLGDTVDAVSAPVADSAADEPEAVADDAADEPETDDDADDSESPDEA